MEKGTTLKVELLTVEQAAIRLRIQPATIRSWILRRTNLEVVHVGRCVRITERSVEKFIADHTVAPVRNSR